MDRVPLLRDRRFALWMGLLAIAGCAFVSFGCYFLPASHHAWLTPDDGWSITNSAQYLTYGGGGSIYSANDAYLTLPGFLFLYAPVVALGDHWGLLTGYPFPLPRPSMWLLSGPFFFLCGATVLPALDYLADVLRVSRYRRKWLSFLVALFIVVPVAELAGHPEDLLAFTFSCLSLGLLLQGRFTGAAFALSAAILMQTWAALLVPLLLVASPPGMRIRTLIRAGLAPAALGALLLMLDFKDASTALLHQPMTGTGEHLPWWSFAGHVTVIIHGHPTSVVAGSSSRSLAVVTALGMAWWLRRRVTPQRLILAAAVVTYGRGLFESEFWPYYLAPAAVLFALTGALTTAGSSKRFTAVLAGAFLLYASAPMAYVGVQYPAGLALAVLLASGALCVAGCLPARLRGLVPIASLPYPAQAG